MRVWSAVRIVLVVVPLPPSDLISLKSVAYAVLVSASGPSLRNCDELSIRNGFTPPTHGVGSNCTDPSGELWAQCPTGIWLRSPFGAPLHCDGP